VSDEPSTVSEFAKNNPEPQLLVEDAEWKRFCVK
jgi:hypothetical protein